MDDRLPTELWVSAHVRRGNLEGIPMMVVRRGDSSRGTVLLKVNRLDGTCTVLSQVRREEVLCWLRATGPDPVPEPEADQCVARELRRDPDLWVIEIEDRQGRHWFEGKVL
jgi:hypothetical protein